VVLPQVHWHACTYHERTFGIPVVSQVKQVQIEGGAGIAIETPGRIWELLPPTRDEAVEWYDPTRQLLAPRSCRR
jgi:hypothetical protein